MSSVFSEGRFVSMDETGQSKKSNSVEMCSGRSERVSGSKYQRRRIVVCSIKVTVEVPVVFIVVSKDPFPGDYSCMRLISCYFLSISFQFLVCNAQRTKRSPFFRPVQHIRHRENRRGRRKERAIGRRTRATSGRSRVSIRDGKITRRGISC